MATSTLVAHAGHPAEWLPFVAPIILVALAWLVIRAREAAETAEREHTGGAERRGVRDDAPTGEEPTEPSGATDRG